MLKNYGYTKIKYWSRGIQIILNSTSWTKEGFSGSYTEMKVPVIFIKPVFLCLKEFLFEVQMFCVFWICRPIEALNYQQLSLFSVLSENKPISVFETLFI